ncbi:hypothetical protein VKT23_008173 [Stygiomarasmius scandens]|uniref:Cytochrome P450 n=1 Tax=Marasmiellus scandens TaxID=2682957 RepID=A0ABR1JHH5_9AGAR
MLDLVGRSIDWLFLNYTTDRLWRDHRKIYHREFDTQTLLHRPYELSATRQLLKRLLDTPYDYVSHLRSTASEAILETTFGIPINSTDDPLLALVERFNTSLDNGMNVLINIFPFFSRLPRWAPGTSFYRIADELRRNSIDMPQIPLSIVQKQMSDGSARSSVALRGLTALEESSTDYTYDFRVLQNVLAGIYAAGADTTLTAMRWFIFSMLKYPEIQAKAHQLIDKQTEGKRLPDFESDFGTLPYIDAILNEVLRFFPVLPIGMPHCVVEDDVYEGYLLPKDAIVFGNSWAIMRDERMYGADTHLFRPDRFLNADGTRNSAIPDPDQAFGYGRRVCAGKNVAREFLWIMIVSILATFEISKVIAQDGSLIDPDGKHSSSLVCHPLPFQCKITPRSNGEKLALNGLDYLSK